MVHITWITTFFQNPYKKRRKNFLLKIPKFIFHHAQTEISPFVSNQRMNRNSRCNKYS